MNKEEQDYLDNFIKDFLSEPLVKQYLAVKKELETSKEILSLKEKLKSSQKTMALSLGTKDYENNKKNYLETKKAYDNHPLIINYQYLEEEVKSLLEELKNALASK